MVGAVFPSTAWAQVDPTRVDTGQIVRPDSLLRAQADSARADSLRRLALADSLRRTDTLRTPMPVFPVELVSDREFVWNREALLSSGAVTLAELVERVPGAAAFNAGWMLPPAAVAHMGDFAAVRLFLDGVELSPLSNRTGGVTDFVDYPLWTLSEVRIERAATELRVHMRSWSVNRTIPLTITDMYTGSEDTNMYRGMFGKRWRNGAVLQLGAQQAAMQSRVQSGEADQFTVLARAGVVRESWGLDAYVQRSALNRAAQERIDGGNTLSAFEGSRSDAYLRYTLGRPAEGAWLQLLGSTSKADERTPGTGNASPEPGQPGADTTREETQYLIALGTTAGSARLSATGRFRSAEGVRSQEVSAVARWRLREMDLGASVRRDTRDSVLVAEGQYQVNLLGRFRLSGAGGYRSRLSEDISSGVPFGYAELGVRFAGGWLSGGAIYRDSVELPAPILFDTAFAGTGEASTFGFYGGYRGIIFGAVGADVSIVRWDDPGAFRPQLETRGKLYLDTSWLERFPSGNLHIHAGLGYTSRSEVFFPLNSGDIGIAPQHSALSWELEFRIQGVAISWHTYNIRGHQYSRVPGFEMPRRVNVFGLRWSWWN